MKDSEWADVEKFIYENRHVFAGISLLSDGGDLDYPQAPFCEILTPEEIIDLYGPGAILASGLIVDGLHAFSNNLWAACDTALGRGESLDAPNTPPNVQKRIAEAYEAVWRDKIDWVRRAKKFADNYFGKDVIKMTRCLKRVHNCKLWQDLTRTIAPVDYTLCLEKQDNTKATETIACAGGKCDII